MKREGFALLLTDFLCAALLSLGTAAVLLPALEMTFSFFTLFLAAAISLLLFASGEKRPWIIPVILLAAALLILLAAALLGRWTELSEGIPEYIRQTVADAASDEKALPLPITLAVVLPVALIFWLLMRKLPSLFLVAAISAAALGYAAIFQQETWITPFLLLCAGNILFLPRKSQKDAGRLRSQALALLLLVPLIGLCLLLGPKSDGEWFSPALRHGVQDIQDFWEFHWGDLPRLPITSMRSMGLQPQSDRLGGDFIPDGETLFTCKEDLLLRGQVLDHYTGSSWTDDPEENPGNFRWSSILWGGRRQEAMGLDLPAPVSVPLMKDLTRDVKTVLYSYWPSRSAFLPYRTRSVSVENRSGDLYFDSQGEVYWAQDQKGRRTYTVDASVWNYRARDFDRNMLYLETAVTENAGEDPNYENAAKYCLQLPDPLPASVAELADSVTTGISSPYQKAVALREYLSENCEYTTTPGPTDPNRDFVDEFLETRRGYCTYYASALTVLCRASGIPARYVTGFAMVRNGDHYEASRATAHAWTEIYLANIGWIPLDSINQNTLEQNAGGEGSGGSTAPVPNPSPAPTSPPSSLQLQDVPASGGGPGLRLILGLCAVLLLATAGAVTGGKLVRHRRYSENYVNKKYPLPEDAANHYYLGITRLLRLLKLEPQSGETFLSFWKRAGLRLNEQAFPNWERVGQIMSRLRFGSTPPSQEELFFLHSAYLTLKNYVNKNSNLLSKLLS